MRTLVSLVEQRRRLVNDRVRITNRLRKRCGITHAKGRLRYHLAILWLWTFDKNRSMKVV